MPALELGRLRIDVVPCGEFRLDGGAMFGQVPKVRWQTFVPADAKNRIVMGTSVLTPTFRYHPSIVAQAFGTLGSDPPNITFSPAPSR